ncbi:MAG: hypothetical protein Udaeo2_30340 [Candidatus Udaeobacter sp.]|nr:MAG: hypothetical protein Udaeo2_30340 [Candidatus Udaeobacter sp.]
MIRWFQGNRLFHRESFHGTLRNHGISVSHTAPPEEQRWEEFNRWRLGRGRASRVRAWLNPAERSPRVVE